MQADNKKNRKYIYKLSCQFQYANAADVLSTFRDERQNMLKYQARPLGSFIDCFENLIFNRFKTKKAIINVSIFPSKAVLRFKDLPSSTSTARY